MCWREFVHFGIFLSFSLGFNVVCRVLFLYGEKDIFSIPEKSRQLFAACASENKKLVWFDKGGHSHLRINNTEKYDRTIIEFLKEQK